MVRLRPEFPVRPLVRFGGGLQLAARVEQHGQTQLLVQLRGDGKRVVQRAVEREGVQLVEGGGIVLEIALIQRRAADAFLERRHEAERVLDIAQNVPARLESFDALRNACWPVPSRILRNVDAWLLAVDEPLQDRESQALVVGAVQKVDVQQFAHGRGRLRKCGEFAAQAGTGESVALTRAQNHSRQSHEERAGQPALWSWHEGAPMIGQVAKRHCWFWASAMSCCPRTRTRGYNSSPAR